MSGIVGILHRDGRPVERSDLARMADALAAWGPDACGLWHAGPVGLGQRTLATTHEALTNNLPHKGREAARVLVADARVDNRDELAAVLAVPVARLTHISDEELIRLAYERWGEACPERLLGDFAFAIWDARTQAVFCARDPMGVRPFCYHLSDELFAFGSQIRALLCLSAVPRRLNATVMADYLALLPPDKANTFYADILRLPPGHSLTVSRDGAMLRRYWRLDPSRELRLASDTEYAEAFQGIFTEAVRCRMRSSSPVAAMLSGGLDSSSIVCTARRLLNPGERITTLSGVFPSFRTADSLVDERRFIELVTAAGDVDAHYIRADNAKPLFDFLWQGEEPIPAAALYMDWSIFTAARERGLRVLLSGNDGDSVVGYGRHYLAELAWTGQWKALLDELYALSRRYGVGRRALVRQYVLTTVVPSSLASTWRMLRARGRPKYDRRSVIRPEFADRTGIWERTRRFYREEHSARRERRAHYASLESSLLTLLLDIFARGAGEFGLEPRYPFFDRRLVEFCLALPGHQKLHEGWDRVVMRRSMAGTLPAEIQWRAAKQNLSANFNLRLLDNRELIEEVVADESHSFDEFVDVAALRDAYARYLANPERRSREAFTVFWTATILLWLRQSDLGP